VDPGSAILGVFILVIISWGIIRAINGPDRRAQQERVLEQRRRLEADTAHERAGRVEDDARGRRERRREQEELKRQERRAKLDDAKAAADKAIARVMEHGAQRAREILTEEAELLGKFLEVTLRKVTLRDEYGDENWKALDDEIERVIAKLKKKRPDIEERHPLEVPTHLKGPDLVPFWQALPPRQRSEVETALAQQLRERFQAHYDATAESRAAPDAAVVAKLDGVAYEAQVMEWLRSLGVEDVRGTPRTGDQGADVLFTYQGHRVVVQCKRYKDTIGNGPVQEVHAAKSIYDCTDAWVITTGRATPGGREAAQRTGVVLIEGATSSQGIRDALAALSSSAPIGTPG
jgi:restriction endonuclease Mrr